MKNRLKILKRYRPRNFIRTALQLEDILYLQFEILKHQKKMSKLNRWKSKKLTAISKIESNIESIKNYGPILTIKDIEYPVICPDDILARYCTTEKAA
jgi:hypothetical protein